MCHSYLKMCSNAIKGNNHILYFCIMNIDFFVIHLYVIMISLLMTLSMQENVLGQEEWKLSI